MRVARAALADDSGITGADEEAMSFLKALQIPQDAGMQAYEAFGSEAVRTGRNRPRIAPRQRQRSFAARKEGGGWGVVRLGRTPEGESRSYTGWRLMSSYSWNSPRQEPLDTTKARLAGQPDAVNASCRSG